MKAAGYQMPPGIEVVRRIHGRGYFDLTLMQWAFYDAFGVPPADEVRLIGGYQPEIEVPPDPLKSAPGRRRQLARLRLMRRLWNFPSEARRASERQLAYERTF